MEAVIDGREKRKPDGTIWGTFQEAPLQIDSYAKGAAFVLCKPAEQVTPEERMRFKQAHFMMMFDIMYYKPVNMALEIAASLNMVAVLREVGKTREEIQNILTTYNNILGKSDADKGFGI